MGPWRMGRLQKLKRGRDFGCAVVEQSRGLQGIKGGGLPPDRSALWTQDARSRSGKPTHRSPWGRTRWSQGWEENGPGWTGRILPGHQPVDLEQVFPFLASDYHALTPWT